MTTWATIVAACAPLAVPVLSTGAYLWKKKRDMKKAKLSVQLDAADLKRIRVWADKSGQSLSEYVRDVLVASIPAKEQVRLDAAPKVEAVMDKAFEELDKMEETPAFPLPPARRPQQGSPPQEHERTHPAQRVVKTTKTALPQAPPGVHPCPYLSSQMPANLRGQCQGTCQHPAQRGRICYWPPTTAMQCNMFEANPALQRAR